MGHIVFLFQWLPEEGGAVEVAEVGVAVTEPHHMLILLVAAVETVSSEMSRIAFEKREFSVNVNFP